MLFAPVGPVLRARSQGRASTHRRVQISGATSKLVDVVGLYLNPPEHALVLSCDEKSQIQALNRPCSGFNISTDLLGAVH
jgi:hypothetical protein